MEHDTADLGRTNDLPALILWGDTGVVGAQTDPINAWRSWLPNVSGHAIPAGHFLAEQATPEVLTHLQQHLAAA